MAAVTGHREQAVLRPGEARDLADGRTELTDFAVVPVEKIPTSDAGNANREARTVGRDGKRRREC